MSVRIDARWLQIGFLGSFLILGALARDFAISPAQVGLCFGAALLTQAAWQWRLRLPQRRHWGGYLSALISSFGICILVRSGNLWAHPLLAAGSLILHGKWVRRLLPLVERLAYGGRLPARLLTPAREDLVQIGRIQR